jgi:hypothetical protein
MILVIMISCRVIYVPVYTPFHTIIAVSDQNNNYTIWKVMVKIILLPNPPITHSLTQSVVTRYQSANHPGKSFSLDPT